MENYQFPSTYTAISGQNNEILSCDTIALKRRYVLFGGHESNTKKRTLLNNERQRLIINNHGNAET